MPRLVMPSLTWRLGPLEITGFGVMIAVGGLVGLWLLSRELKRAGLPSHAADAGVFGLLGGLVGAKLLYVAEHLFEEPLLMLLASRGGLSWFGGVVGGAAAGLFALRRRRVPVLPVLAAATPGLAVGQLLGRIGCFLVGDDYGRPTRLPWGVAFPQGLPPAPEPVHPTQLYEAAWLALVLALLLHWRRRGDSERSVLARYLWLAGGGRFVLEFVRVNREVALGMTVAQWASLALVAAGIALALWPAMPHTSDAPAPEG